MSAGRVPRPSHSCCRRGCTSSVVQDNAHTLTDMAVLHLEAHRDDIGGPLLECALEIQRQRLEDDDPDVSDSGPAPQTKSYMIYTQLSLPPTNLVCFAHSIPLCSGTGLSDVGTHGAVTGV
jgi:hypothetical protein